MGERPPFLRQQLVRARLRWYVFSHGLQSAIFWTFYVTLWALAAQAGFGWIGWYGIVIYVLALAPLLVLQFMLVADLFAFIVIGKIFAFPTLLKLWTDWQSRNPQRITVTPRMRVFAFIGNSSPLSSLATWSLIVLARMPESTHGNVTDSVRVQEAELKSAVYETAWDRLRVA